MIISSGVDLQNICLTMTVLLHKWNQVLCVEAPAEHFYCLLLQHSLLYKLCTMWVFMVNIPHRTRKITQKAGMHVNMSECQSSVPTIMYYPSLYQHCWVAQWLLESLDSSKATSDRLSIEPPCVIGQSINRSDPGSPKHYLKDVTKKQIFSITLQQVVLPIDFSSCVFRFF